jgi:hypothetical protein
MQAASTFSAAYKKAQHTHFGGRYMPVRSIIFYPMLWVRPLFLYFSKLIGWGFTASSLMVAIVTITTRHFSSYALIETLLLGFLGFGTFMLRQKYDSILLNINPTDHELHLWQ